MLLFMLTTFEQRQEMQVQFVTGLNYCYDRLLRGTLDRSVTQMITMHQLLLICIAVNKKVFLFLLFL